MPKINLVFSVAYYQRKREFLRNLFLSVALFLSSCQNNSIKESPVTDYASKDSSTKYAGMDKCKSCHLDIYETFIQTGMGLSWDNAKKLKSKAQFNPKYSLHDQYKNLKYVAVWRGDSLYFREFRTSNIDTIYQRQELINYIVGSGQHTNSHIVNRNGYLFQAPMTYYTQSNTWDFPPGFEKGNNSRFQREIGLECISCHNAYPDMVLGSENKYTLVHSGIDCERCHGPGSVHVDEKLRGIIVNVSEEIDYSIVNPAKLTVNLQFDVCQRCHIQGNAVLNPGKSFYDFKPGSQLSDVMNVFMPVYTGQENEHIMASHVERLKMSSCYINSIDDQNTNTNSNLTCITCHNPHVSVKVTDPEKYNRTCKSCHQTKESNCALSEIELQKENGDCVACHMKKSGSIDIPHVRVTDHFIRIPNQGKLNTTIQKKLLTIKSIHNPNPPSLSIAKAWMAYFEKFGFDKSALDSAAYYLNKSKEFESRLNYISTSIHLNYLRNDYISNLDLLLKNKNIIAEFNTQLYSNQDAWTCYRMAESVLALNEQSIAYAWISKACLLSPFNLEFQNRKASLEMDMKMFSQAQSTLRFILKENADDQMALCNLGYNLLITTRDTAKARFYYNRALALNPDYEQALLNTAALELLSSNIKSASIILNRVLKINPDNRKAKELLLKL